MVPARNVTQDGLLQHSLIMGYLSHWSPVLQALGLGCKLQQILGKILLSAQILWALPLKNSGISFCYEQRFSCAAVSLCSLTCSAPVSVLLWVWSLQEEAALCRFPPSPLSQVSGPVTSPSWFVVHGSLSSFLSLRAPLFCVQVNLQQLLCDCFPAPFSARPSK